MKTINMLGSASESTKGEEFNSIQLDPEGVKIPDGGLLYCTATPGDGKRALCPA